MIISYYGKKFLRKFNEVENKNLTPKEFFINIFYPLFYSGRSLMCIQNSPFSNPANKKKSSSDILELFFKKIRDKEFDASMFVGGYAVENTATTSFNVSINYKHLIDEDEVLYSWFGHALSLRFKGIDFLFDNENFLYDVYLGWNKYSQLLNDPLYVKFKGNQISTWNTHWINNYYSMLPAKKFNPLAEYKENLESISWIKVLFYICQKYNNDIINSYVYKFGQTNETYGNITIETFKIGGFLKFCQKCFGENNFLNQTHLYEKIFGTGYSMEKICEFGSIGMLAIKPEFIRLEEYTHKSLDVQKKIKKHYQDAINDKSIYEVYNLYIMSLLNDETILPQAVEIATSLFDFQNDTRKNNNILVEDIINSSNLTKFLKHIGDIQKICAEENLTNHSEIFNKFVMLVLENETNLNNLIFLIRYQYYYIKNKS